MSSTIFFFLFIPLLAFILLAVNLIFAPHNPYMEKNSAFECGFSSFLGQNRTQFSISFFIFALLFLLFDLEILLVYPYLVSAYTNGVYGLVVMLMFLLALTLGFAFELGKKALFIDSRQMSNVATNSKSNYIRKVNINISPFLHRGKRHYSSLNNSAQFETKIIDSILYSLSRQVMLVLSSFLLLSLFLYLVIYIFGLTSFTPYFNNILLFLLFLIHHATNFYNNTKTKACVSAKTNIKPYSNNEYIIDFIISTGEFFSELIKGAMFVVSIICSPFIILLSAVYNKIKNVIIGLYTDTPHYKAIMCTYHEKDFFYLLDTLSLDVHHFIIRNILNIISYFLLFMFGVYMGFIPLSLFLLNTYVIFLSFSIVYICKYRSFFKNDIVFLICLAALLLLFGLVSYCIYLHILGAYSLLIGDNNNKSPSGPPGKPGGPEGGGGPGDPDGNHSFYREPEGHKRRRNINESDSDPDADAEGITDSDADAEGDTDYEIEYRDMNQLDPKGITNKRKRRKKDGIRNPLTNPLSKEEKSASNKAWLEIPGNRERKAARNKEYSQIPVVKEKIAASKRARIPKEGDKEKKSAYDKEYSQRPENKERKAARAKERKKIKRNNEKR